ncbi:hypothetical protein TrCOL_g13261 [Triparma columacea]|uniref:Elongation of fatty acids protein n=1 Tax=Triparma columacea TaxID=722753 RepID=A0A9W7G4Q5_9STRA|nr:hypothetical protein TrCOL_g13261 [Triparma columacea]
MAVFDFSKLTDFSTYHEQSFVALALFFYLAISKKATAKFRDLVGLDPKSPFLKAFVFLHNAALAVFSLVVFLKSTPLVVSHYAANGWESLHCSSAFWNEGFGFWANIFYISKYYEFVDSWILILKGKECSFLQVYHHTGIAIAMWLGTRSEANWLLWVAVLNSFIHTLMYTYFSAATLGYRSPLAQALTTAQLTQFMIGLCGASSGYFYKGCMNESQRFSLIFIQVYAIGLIYLFYEMYKAKYKAKKHKKK